VLCQNKAADGAIFSQFGLLGAQNVTFSVTKSAQLPFQSFPMMREIPAIQNQA